MNSAQNRDKAIEVNDLHKRYGELQAVKGASFEVYQGEIVSLVGPNGAGKSTIISMLSCLLSPDSGDALIMGYSVKNQAQKVKKLIGIVPQEIALYPDLTAMENLKFWGRMYGLSGSKLRQRVDEVLELTGLSDRAKERADKYSGGMKRRLNIGIALLHNPQVVYMDEPTVGIDPQSRRNILDGVKALNRIGMTMLYTTHYMEEAQELSNRIVVMDKGQVIASGTHTELVRIIGGLDRIELKLNEQPQKILDSWQKLEGVNRVSLGKDNSVTLLVEDNNVVLPQLFDSAARRDIRITSIEITEPNLESVFLHLTGRALRD